MAKLVGAAVKTFLSTLHCVMRVVYSLSCCTISWIRNQINGISEGYFSPCPSWQGIIPWCGNPNSVASMLIRDNFTGFIHLPLLPGLWGWPGWVMIRWFLQPTPLPAERCKFLLHAQKPVRGGSQRGVHSSPGERGAPCASDYRD